MRSILPEILSSIGAAVGIAGWLTYSDGLHQMYKDITIWGIATTGATERFAGSALMVAGIGLLVFGLLLIVRRKNSN